MYIHINIYLLIYIQIHHVLYIGVQRCGNIEPITGHFDLFSPLLSCSPYTLYTALFQFTGHSLDLSDNVLHDWLFPHHCRCACTCIYVCMCILCKHIICVSVSTSGVAELVFVDFFNGNKDEFRITKIRIGEER